jgi:uncharacterized circularly permuted ATP-grasp superfamily protein
MSEVSDLMEKWPNAPDDAFPAFSSAEWMALEKAIRAQNQHVQLLNEILGETELQKRLLRRAILPFVIVADKEGRGQPAAIAKLSEADFRNAKEVFEETSR